MVIVPIATRLSAIAELIATGNLFAGTKVILYQNNIMLSDFTTLADLTEATFTGYARSAAITWGTPYVNPSQQATSTGASIQFSCTGTAVTQLVYGWALIIDSTVDVLMVAEAFAEPVSMDGVGAAVVVNPSVVW